MPPRLTLSPLNGSLTIRLDVLRKSAKHALVLQICKARAAPSPWESVSGNCGRHVASGTHVRSGPFIARVVVPLELAEAGTLLAAHAMMDMS